MASIRYRYFQPADGGYHYGTGPDSVTSYTLAYAGSIGTTPSEPTEEVLERLWVRHTSDLRPHGFARRTLGTGDLLDLGERGVWQADTRGFRPFPKERLRVGSAA